MKRGDAAGSTVGDILLQRGVAQLVARLLWEQDAAGSNPVTPTISSVHKVFHFMNARFSRFISLRRCS